jgi:hypothetical protein
MMATSTYDPDQTSGELPQAIARKNAPRGGTPNAPETPGANNVSGIPRGQQLGAMGDPGYFSAQPVRDAISAVQPYVPGGRYGAQMGDQVSRAYKEGGAGAAVGEGVRQLAGGVVAVGADIARPAIPVFDAAAQGLKTLVTGDSSPIQSAGASAPTPPQPAAVPTPATSYGANDRGAGYTAPAAAPSSGGYQGQSVAVPASAPVPTIAGPSSIDLANQRASGQLAVMRAQDNQNAQDNRAAMIAQGNNAQARFDVERARGEARVANFNAANGADMVLRGGTNAQKTAILANRDSANTQLLAAEGRANKTADALVGTPRNYLDEAAKGQGIEIAARHAANTDAQAPVQNQLLNQQVASNALHQEISRLAIEGTKKQQSLINQIQAETDPAKQRQLVATLLASQGKERPDVHELVHLKGGTDPNNPLVTLPDQAYVLNKATGQAQRIDTQTPQAGAAKVPTQDEWMKQARADPRNKGFDDAYLKNFYQSKYGNAGK